MSRDLSGVPCGGKDGGCDQTFTVHETSAAEGTTDPSSFDCGGRCDD